jgi:hypothetical protein
MRLESQLKRRGKRTGVRPQRQKIPDNKILEIPNLHLPIAEAANRAGISQTAFYRRAQRRGWNTGAARSQQQGVVRLVFELRKWIALQPQIPTTEQITQPFIDELRRGSLTPTWKSTDGTVSHWK